MQNFDLAKTLDTAIKAPLWIWFALMIASLIPMFNFSNLVETGVDSNFRLGPVPLSFAALGFTALVFFKCYSSLLELAWPPDWCGFGTLVVLGEATPATA